MIFQDALGLLNPVKTIGYQLVEAIRLTDQSPRRRPGRRCPAEVGVQTPRERLDQHHTSSPAGCASA
jgi:ABC-type microcin C transport system duplicated ATPase subunit YejF